MNSRLNSTFYNHLSFLNLSGLSASRRVRSSRSDGPMIPCPNNCGKQYKHKFNLNRHIRYECGVAKQFRCSECHKMFSQKSSLKSHLGCTNGLFTCENGCGRVYKRKNTWIRHMRYECAGVQDILRLFSCPICQKRFSHKFLVRKHLVTVHERTDL
ncbi:zinc finger protein 559-like [Planococcus citri]|uniref:zinc finger protein 559-like n=1 Tax=Planococcus citri TaxID=170843 RepID=UPI0031F817BC